MGPSTHTGGFTELRGVPGVYCKVCGVSDGVGCGVNSHFTPCPRDPGFWFLPPSVAPDTVEPVVEEGLEQDAVLPGPVGPQESLAGDPNEAAPPAAAPQPVEDSSTQAGYFSVPPGWDIHQLGRVYRAFKMLPEGGFVPFPVEGV